MNIRYATTVTVVAIAAFVSLIAVTMILAPTT